MIAEYVKPVDEVLEIMIDGSTSSKVDQSANDGISKPTVFNHISSMTSLTISDDITQLYNKHMNEIIQKMSTFQEKVSG